MQEKTKKILKGIAIGGVFVAGAACGAIGFKKIIPGSAGSVKVVTSLDNLFPGFRVSSIRFGKVIFEDSFVFDSIDAAKEFAKTFLECTEFCAKNAQK